MGYFTGQRVNEGIHLECENFNVDLIVRKIYGNMNCREVDLEVKGIESVKFIHISNKDGLVHLVEDIYIGVSNHGDYYEDKVNMHYKIPKKIKLIKRFYK